MMASIHGGQVEKIKNLFEELVITIGSSTVLDLARKQASIEEQIKSDMKEMEKLFENEEIKELNK